MDIYWTALVLALGVGVLGNCAVEWKYRLDSTERYRLFGPLAGWVIAATMVVSEIVWVSIYSQSPNTAWGKASWWVAAALLACPLVIHALASYTYWGWRLRPKVSDKMNKIF